MPPRRRQTGSRPGQTPVSAGNRPRQQSATPRIDRMQARGMTKQEILDALNGPNNLRDLTEAQLKAIGFVDKRITSYMALQERRNRGQDRGKADKDGGQGQGNQGEYPEETDPQDPMEGEWEQQERESAFAAMQMLLDQYGLGSLSGFLQTMIQNGETDPASLQLALQNTPEWKQRFRGNELLRQQGLGVLSPAEYLNLERSYASIMRQFGLPPGFYDTNEDFVNFIGNGVSPQELAERASMAVDLANQVDPTQRETLRSMYGIGEGDIAAYFLDAKKAQPILQKQVQAVKIASAGKRAGLGVGNNRARFEDMVDRGVNEQMAQQGYANIANEFDPLRNLAAIWGRGDDWTLMEAEDATFFGDAEAKRERRGLIQQEQAAFSGASGFRAGVSGRRSSAGRF